MNLVIDGNLSYVPSEISCFRDITLYSTIWGEFDVLVEIDREYRDHVWYHLKSHGAYDYVEAIVSVGREPGYKIGDRPGCNLKVDKITCENVSSIITCLNRFG